jgi:hypothetical protein
MFACIELKVSNCGKTNHWEDCESMSEFLVIKKMKVFAEYFEFKQFETARKNLHSKYIGV